MSQDIHQRLYTARQKKVACLARYQDTLDMYAENELAAARALEKEDLASYFRHSSELHHLQATLDELEGDLRDASQRCSKLSSLVGSSVAALKHAVAVQLNGGPTDLLDLPNRGLIPGERGESIADIEIKDEFKFVRRIPYGIQASEE